MEKRYIVKWAALCGGVLLVMAAAVALLVKTNVKETIERIHPIASVDTQFPSSEGYQVADGLLSAYLRPIPDKGYQYHDIRFSKLLKEEGDELTIVVTFDLHLSEEERKKHPEWGVPGSDGVLHCEWVVTANRLNGGRIMPEDRKQNLPRGVYYELANVEYLEDVLKEKGSDRQKLGIPVQLVEPAQNACRREGNEVSVTWDGGETWAKLPVGLEALTTRGEKVSDRSELQPGSYYISPERLAFVYGGSVQLPCTLLLSEDQGKTWSIKKLPIADDDGRQWVRACYIGFAPDGTGYIGIGAFRERNSESVQILRSKDGGKTWEKVAFPASPYYGLVRGVSFVSGEVGFVAKGESLFRTEDGGLTWEEKSFTGDLQYPQPLAPVFTDAQNGTLIVAQGPNGDLGDGSRVKQYVTSDAGKTWRYEQMAILEKPGLCFTCSFENASPYVDFVF